MTLILPQRTRLATGGITTGAIQSIGTATTGQFTTNNSSGGTYSNFEFELRTVPPAGQKRAMFCAWVTVIDHNSGSASVVIDTINWVGVGAPDSFAEYTYNTTYPSNHLFAIWNDVPSGTGVTDIDLDYQVSGSTQGCHGYAFPVYYNDDATALALTTDGDWNRTTTALSTSLTTTGNDAFIASAYAGNDGSVFANDLGGGDFGTWIDERDIWTNDVTGFAVTSNPITHTNGVTATLADPGNGALDALAICRLSIS